MLLVERESGSARSKFEPIVSFATLRNDALEPRHVSLPSWYILSGRARTPLAAPACACA